MIYQIFSWSRNNYRIAIIEFSLSRALKSSSKFCFPYRSFNSVPNLLKDFQPYYDTSIRLYPVVEHPKYEEHGYCHSLVLILILISIKTRIDNIFGQNTTPPPGTQPCLILPKILTFQVSHQNKRCLSILE